MLILHDNSKISGEAEVDVVEIFPMIKDVKAIKVLVVDHILRIDNEAEVYINRAIDDENNLIVKDYSC